MDTIAEISGHSAVVELELIVGGRSVELSQVAPEFLIVQHPENLAPCQAEVIVRVDGDENRRRVFLVDGISASSARVRVRNLPL
jgi:hypothetical protein